MWMRRWRCLEVREVESVGVDRVAEDRESKKLSHEYVGSNRSGKTSSIMKRESKIQWKEHVNLREDVISSEEGRGQE